MIDALLVILGPTGVGKTEAAIDLSKRLKAEIISADSRKIYKGMDIGTAKPSQTIRRRIPHWLIDIFSPEEVFSAADFREQAKEIIQRVQKKDKLPILVGGSSLYIRAVVDGLFVGPAADWDLRERLKEKERKEGRGALYKELERVDPLAASRLHPHDERRIIRALEVYELSGKPISFYQRQTPSSLSNTVIIGLTKKRESLYRSINMRVEKMVEKGLIREVKSLLASGYSEELPSMQGLGYQQVIGHLKGKYSKEEAIRLIKRDTRRFARRQLNWFKKDKRILWLDRDEFSSVSPLSDEIIKIFLQKHPVNSFGFAQDRLCKSRLRNSSFQTEIDAY